MIRLIFILPILAWTCGCSLLLDPEDVTPRCNQQGECPQGFHCVDDLCRPGEPDAGTDADAGADEGSDPGADPGGDERTDAGADDGGTPDSGDTVDAGGDEVVEIGIDCTICQCFPVPPTGQDQCYDNQNELTPCPGNVDNCGVTEFCGQDAQYPPNDRNFNERQIGSDWIVEDTLTGLIWQKAAVSAKQWQEAKEHCEISGHAGESDWRLPTPHELRSIIDYGRFNPAVDPDVFGSSTDLFWTDTEFDSGNAWGVHHSNGDIEPDPKDSYNTLRCVRGGNNYPGADDRFTYDEVQGNQVAFDRLTGLTWRVAISTEVTWKDALLYCAQTPYAGKNDWRLPDVNELASTIDYGTQMPASQIPTSPGDTGLWSSTTDVESPRLAKGVFFDYGIVDFPTKTASTDGRARCVRGPD